MDIAYVPEYFSSSDSTDEDAPELIRKKPRAAPREWEKIREFETKEEAEEYVRSRHIWKKSAGKDLAQGRRIDYRCVAGKYRSNECPAGLYLLYHAENMRVSMFETMCDHDNHDADPSRGLPIDIQNFVRQRFDEGIQKPNALLAAIKRNKFLEPSKHKLVSFLKRLRQEKYGKASVSAGEIHAWCNGRKEIPSDEDEPFVLDFFIKADSDEQDLKIVMSTKRLLCNLRKSAMVQIDATYKLIWQGYPVMILGTSDKNQVFHPFGLVVCKSESADDYSFIFHAFHTYDLEWNPTILLADASEAIIGGFRNVFGEPSVRVMCFFQVLKNLEKHLKGFKKERRSQLKSDISTLQTCIDETSFLNAVELFFCKWRGHDGQRMEEFLDYFDAQWISKRSSWYEGAAPGYPSTNNGLEATNAIIKREHTLRERLPVGQFLSNVRDLLLKWSQSRNPSSPNCIHFADVRTVNLSEWTKAYQWAARNGKVLKGKNEKPDHAEFFANSSSSGRPITPADVTMYVASYGKWDDFDSFRQVFYGTWRITLNTRGLETSQCSCPYFAKRLTCKHILGMQIRLKMVDPPPEAKSVPMGQKCKRGRPRKAKYALLLD